MGETVTSNCARFLLNDSHWDPISCDTGLGWDCWRQAHIHVAGIIIVIVIIVIVNLTMIMIIINVIVTMAIRAGPQLEYWDDHYGGMFFYCLSVFIHIA